MEIDVWDGEERKLPKDREANESEAKEEKEGLRSRVADAIRKHRDKSPMKLSSDTRSAESMPAPWTTASSKIRAEPRVLHGYTLTKEVPFRDVCEAIREAAFAAR